MSKEKNVLVAGANGTTGRIIVDLLKVSKNYQPIAMVRNKEQKDRFEKEHVMTVMADLEEVLDALNDVEKANFKLQQSYFDQRRAVTNLLNAKGALTY